MVKRTLKTLAFVAAALACVTAFSGILPVGDVPVTGMKMRLSDTSGPHGRRNSVVLRAGDSSGVFPDPRVMGATASIGRVGAGEVTMLDLPASGWSGRGSTRQDYKFKSRTGVVISARLRAGGSLRFSARGDGAYPLGGVPQGDVGIILEVAGVRFCGLFGGTKLRDDGKRFRARLAPAPDSCPVLGSTTTSSASTSSTSTTSTSTSSSSSSSSTTSSTTVPCNPAGCRLCELICRREETLCRLTCTTENFNCRATCTIPGHTDNVPACQAACDAAETVCLAGCGNCEPECSTSSNCEPGCGCPAGLEACGSTCSDTSTDRFNCGGCGNPCVGFRSVCTDGTCSCTPDCTGRECGDDGCGGSCGSCDMSVCDSVDGLCKACIPDGHVFCSSGSDCCSGFCFFGGACAPMPTTTSTTLP